MISCPVASAPQEATALLFHGAAGVGDLRFSYAQLSAQVARWHGRLAGQRRVAVLSGNSPMLVAIIHAAARAGCELALLNTRLTLPELSAQVAQLSPSLCLASPPFAPLLPGARVLDELGAAGTEPVPLPALEPASRPIDESAVHALLFTSGTTGRPRAVQLTVAALQASARAVNQALGVRAGSRFVCSLPLFHVGGLGIALRCALSGATLELHEQFEARAVAQALEGATHVSLVATTLARVLDEGVRLPWVLALIGGGPIPPALLERARAAGLDAVETYGLTEAASSVTIDGVPVPGTEVRVVDGEVLVRGPTLMRGYLGEPTLQGFFRTGDLGEFDRRGRLIIHARRSDLILSGGENIYPAEVETALLSHPRIAEAAVLPAPDPRWGQVGLACVVLHREAQAPAQLGEPAQLEEPAQLGAPPRLAPPTLQLDELAKFLAPLLARYKIPQQLVLLDALPRTALGKVDRPALRALLGLG